MYSCRSDWSQDLPRDARPPRVDANTPDYPQVALAYSCEANQRRHNELALREQGVHASRVSDPSEFYETPSGQQGVCTLRR